MVEHILPVQESHYTSDTVTVLLLLFCLSLGHQISCASSVPLLFFPLPVQVVPCPLGSNFFFRSFPPCRCLAVLISHSSPAHSILFALGQDKHCLCVTPKTFHRLSRFQHGPDISIIVLFLLWECFRESENGKKKGEEGKEQVTEGGGAQKGQLLFPPWPH